MAEQRSNPANANLNIHPSPPSTATQSSAPFTPRSNSVADDSDAEFDPTPIHSPRGGPTYDDLPPPPSYDEAQQQALNDARSGIAPLDANQIEAHRVSSNEGPNEPEIWEYRVRGENPDAEDEYERAPEYENITTHLGTTVPIQHVQGSEDIPVGRTTPRGTAPDSVPDLNGAILTQALGFTRHEPDNDVQYAPRLTRIVAVPQYGTPVYHRRESANPIQFLRAYAKALHAHSIRPAEFTEFLDNLNALCLATGTTVQDLVSEEPTNAAGSTLVYDYINGANEAFFAPRGLRISFRTLHALVDTIPVPTERGQRAGAMASVFDEHSTAEQRAQALHPWVEALDTNVPEPSTQTMVLREMSERLMSSWNANGLAPTQSKEKYLSEKNDDRVGKSAMEDPPHSLPEATSGTGHIPHSGPWDHFEGRHHGRGGRRGHPRGPWTPFGAPGNGPFGPSDHGPFGAPGRGLLGARGRSQWGGNRAAYGSRGVDMSQPTRELSALGRDIGKLGEEFGKMMGEWGQQFGKQADAWGQGVGRRASAWGEEVSARASGSGTQNRGFTPQTDAPPSYDAGPASQETGILRGDSKSEAGSPKLEKKSLGKQAIAAKDNDDDDDSSVSSDSESDSDSDLDLDSDSDEDNTPDTEAMFIKRVRSINKQAEAAKRKGKKSAQEIEHERDLAIEAAETQKTNMDYRFELKRSRQAVRRDFNRRSKELRQQYRQKQSELKAAHTGKGKVKKTSQWKVARKEYRGKRKELKKERMAAKKVWREVRNNSRKMRKKGDSSVQRQVEIQGEMVWVVIENLAT